MVGTCDKKDDKCTAFVDPMDKTNASLGRPHIGQPYYYIKENTLSGDCNGQVGQKEGCLLFHDTTEGVVADSYSAGSSYKKSELSNNDLVNPLSVKQAFDSIVTANGSSCSDRTLCKAVLDALNDGQTPGAPEIAQCVGRDPAMKDLAAQCTNDFFYKYGYFFEDDANVVLKVVRDRECSQWYDCRFRLLDARPDARQICLRCQELGLCDSLRAAPAPAVVAILFQKLWLPIAVYCQ